MKSSLSVLLLGFTSIIYVSGTFKTAHIAVIDEIQKENSAILHIEQRRRRETEARLQSDVAISQTFCFCGKENWLRKLSLVDFTQSVICAGEAKLIVSAAEKDELLSKPSTVLKSTQCMYECIFHSLHLLTSDGQLNKTAVKDVFRDKVFVEEGLKETADNVLDRCLNKGSGNQTVGKNVLAVGRNTNCKTDSHNFIICLLTEMVAECPENMKRNDEPRCKHLYELSKTVQKEDELIKL